MSMCKTGAEVRTAVTSRTEMDYIVFGHGARSFVILPGLSIHSVMGAASLIAQAYGDFADAYTVYVFDRARSIDTGYSVADMARDTALAMRALGVADADVFGASQGGMIAQLLAAREPGLVRRLVLASTLCRPNPVFDSALGEWIRLEEAAEAAPSAEGAPSAEDALLERFTELVYAPATVERYGEALLAANRGITPEEYRRLRIFLHACEGFDSTGELGRIHAPTLVLGALGDRVTGADGSRELARRLTAEFFLYPETFGHAVYDEAPDFRSRMLEFFER